MLVVAPLRVAQSTWPAEIQKWDEFKDLKFIVLHGSDKEMLLKKQADIYIINYEGLPWLTSQQWSGCDVLVWDELTRMKSWSANRVKAIKPFLPTFKYRLGLTGTPVPNGLGDLFSQIYMLDLGKRFTRSITKYRDKYFKPINIYNRKLVPYDSAVGEIYDKIKDLCFRIDANDWINIPKEIHTPLMLTLPNSLKVQYNELKKEAILELQSMSTITAVNAAVLLGKLRQFLSGSIYVNNKVEHIHDYKLTVLKEFIDDLNGEPILVAYQYRHEIAKFRITFPQASFIESGMSNMHVNKIIADWNAGKIPILFGHPQSIGHGLNLQEACSKIMFYSLDFNLENYQQFIKRVSRQGQTESHVLIYYLVFSNTIDEYLLSVLSNKADLQTSLLNFLTNDI